MRDDLFIVTSSYVDDDLRIDPCWETSPGEGMNSKMRRVAKPSRKWCRS